MIYHRLLERSQVTEFWELACKGLGDPARHFGPEWTEPRPRAIDIAYHIIQMTVTATLSVRGTRDEDIVLNDPVALIWIQAPSVTTRAFGMGLFEGYRGQGLGPLVRDAAYELAFADPLVQKLESSVYGSNSHSLHVLHGKAPRAKLEGIQRATVRIGDVFYDRYLYGLTRDEWQTER